jgi:hypothetical protein
VAAQTGGFAMHSESEKFAQHLHSFRGDIEFAQFLHKLEFCTILAQDFSPKDATDCQNSLANKRNNLLFYGQ